MLRAAFWVTLLALPAVASRVDQETVEAVVSSHDVEDQNNEGEHTVDHFQMAREEVEQLKLALTGSLSAAEEAEAAKREQLAGHSSVLLSLYTNLTMDSDEVASQLQTNGKLAEAVASNLELTKTGRGKAHEQKALASLLQRVKSALTEEQTKRLEASLKRKDATPCACFLESALTRGGKLKLADLDSAPSYGYCPQSCFSDCKRMGTRYKFDPHEAEEIGAQGVYQSVVAAQCKGGCQCLDATKTTQNVLRVKAAMYGSDIDIVKELGPAGNYVSQEACLQNCHCSDYNGLDWEGLCMDEWFQNGGYQQPGYGGHHHDPFGGQRW